MGTFNRAEMLGEVLNSLTQLETTGGLKYELVIVDNASTDDTEKVIRNTAPGNAVRIRYELETTQGVAAARNKGIVTAAGEWIAFHDDDQTADPRWLVELLKMAQKKECQIVGGDVQLRLPENNTRQLEPVCRRLLGEMVGLEEECLFTRKVIPGTNNLFVHKSVFEKVGLFDVDRQDGGEDADLYRRFRVAGYLCWFTPAAIIHHIIPEYRMNDAYMRWTAMRQGGHVALREQRNMGTAKLTLITAARFVQAVLLYLPPWMMAKLFSKNKEKVLDARCLLWRSEGYIRHALTYILPGLFKQEAFLASLNFREGRQKLAK